MNTDLKSKIKSQNSKSVGRKSGSAKIWVIVAVLLVLAGAGAGVYVYAHWIILKSQPIADPPTPMTPEDFGFLGYGGGAIKDDEKGKSIPGTPPIVDEVPNIIKNITRYPGSRSQSSENDQQVLGQVTKDVQGGKFQWFKDPVEVAKRYGNFFGIDANARYVLEAKPQMGGDSGLWHASVSAASNSKKYSIALIAINGEPRIWTINAVTEVE